MLMTKAILLQENILSDVEVFIGADTALSSKGMKMAWCQLRRAWKLLKPWDWEDC